MADVDMSEVWRQERVGYLTASVAADVLTRSKAKGKEGQPLAGYHLLMKRLVAEQLTGLNLDNTPVTPAMQWGIDHEAEAAGEYEARTGRMVKGDGKVFVKHAGIPWLGASPDRFVGDDGLLEIKCPSTPVQVQRVLDGVVPADYVPQMTVQLLCTGRKWVDFVSWDPRLLTSEWPGAAFFMLRFEPSAADLQRAQGYCEEFINELALRVTEARGRKKE